MANKEWMRSAIGGIMPPITYKFGGPRVSTILVSELAERNDSPIRVSSSRLAPLVAGLAIDFASAMLCVGTLRHRNERLCIS